MIDAPKSCNIISEYSYGSNGEFMGGDHEQYEIDRAAGFLMTQNTPDQLLLREVRELRKAVDQLKAALTGTEAGG